VCLRALWDTFQSGCADRLDPSSCLCGDVDRVICLGGAATPDGPLYNEYKADFGSTTNDILAVFTNQAYGVGQANALLQCITSFGCNCFGSGDGGSP
jgi:hypothetical protein